MWGTAHASPSSTRLLAAGSGQRRPLVAALQPQARTSPLEGRHRGPAGPAQPRLTQGGRQPGPRRRGPPLCRAVAPEVPGGPPPGGGGGAGGGAGAGGPPKGLGGEGEGEDDEVELVDLQQAEEMAAARGVGLPQDLAALAATEGLRRACLEAFLALKGFGAWASRASPAIRNRLIQDPRFLFKILAEVGIDAGCATVAEIQKRGPDFWAEFDFYLSDLVVGCVLDVVLVSLMAPPAVLGRRPPAAPRGLGALLAAVPSACCVADTPARRYSLAGRAACLPVKFLEYSLAAMVCGYTGQAAANGLVRLKRHVVGAREGDVALPPVGRTALVWGLFMGVSSNVRYQIVFGLERLVDVTVGRRVPAAAYASTVVLRFANNIVGGMQFVDMARWAGIQ